MEPKLTFNQKMIVDKQFTKNVKGYDPEEVDDFLDKVVADYLAYDEMLKRFSDYVKTLEIEKGKLTEKIQSLEVENASLKEKTRYLKPSDHPTEENIGYLNRMRYLELVLTKNNIPFDK